MDVWVFSGEGSKMPVGVFSTRERADAWILANRLCGTLTKYPVDVSLYDWAIDAGIFKPKRDYHRDPEFIETFTCASAEHYHYERDDYDED
jgi:hypothetical protein